MAGKKPQAVTVPYEPARKYRRFDLRFPVSLAFPVDRAARILSATSRNISLGGLLLEAGHSVPVGTHVNLTVSVPTPQSHRPLRLRGEGEIVRVEALDSTPGFAIAVECKQPLIEIRDSLPVAC